jgi:hypothetical protein
MSLINDALKKAARQRAQDQGDLPPMPGGGSRRAGRQGPQVWILLGAAAVALIVVSVVATGVFINGKGAAAAAAVAKATPTAPPAPAGDLKAPAVVVLAPAKAAEPTPTPTPTAVPTSPPRPTALPQIVVRSEEPSPAAGPAPGQREAVQALIDHFHVAGVRTAGAGSKALIDGHVYRIHDLMDASLGLRLTEIADDHLTFVDSSGATYVRGL